MLNVFVSFFIIMGKIWKIANNIFLLFFFLQRKFAKNGLGGTFISNHDNVQIPYRPARCDYCEETYWTYNKETLHFFHLFIYSL